MLRSHLAKELGVLRTNLIKWEQAGLIPAPVRVSYRRAVYSDEAAEAVRAYVAEAKTRHAARAAAHAGEAERLERAAERLLARAAGARRLAAEPF